MSWDPTQYLKFADVRMRPAVDLLARIAAVDPVSVVDLGCGTGNLAPLLMQRWPHTNLIGVDSSTEMLTKARNDHPGVNFVRADVASWRPAQPVEVIYSNAAMHWVEHHDTIFPRLLSDLSDGGWLAIQMPYNFSAPSHTCVTDAIEQGPWRVQLEPHLRRNPVADVQHYWQLLNAKCAHLDIWECEYLQVLKGENPVAEFVKGSWLKQFLDRLQEPERTAFESEYRARVRRAYPPQTDGHTLFPFKRLFIVAQR